MTLKNVSFYMALCDNCGASAGTFYPDKYPGPQDVTACVVDRFKWTAFHTIYHCARCPLLCASCGRQDVDCDCIGGPNDTDLTPSGDAPYVSREPNVVDPLGQLCARPLCVASDRCGGNCGAR